MGASDAKGALESGTFDLQVIVPDPDCGDVVLGDGAADDLNIGPDPDCHLLQGHQFSIVWRGFVVTPRSGCAQGRSN